MAGKGGKTKGRKMAKVSHDSKPGGASMDGGASMEGDNKERYTFFFRAHSPFSQWHACSFTVNGVEYNCAEQFMMHQKAELFQDKEMAEKILASKDPKEQKRMGRQVRNFDEGKWKDACRGIVRAASMAKFSQNEHLKEELFKTEGTVLVEASPFDRIWGIGLSKDNPKALRKATWRGKNWLGYTLTEVRDELMRQEGQTNMNCGDSQKTKHTKHCETKKTDLEQTQDKEGDKSL